MRYFQRCKMGVHVDHNVPGHGLGAVAVGLPDPDAIVLTPRKYMSTIRPAKDWARATSAQQSTVAMQAGNRARMPRPHQPASAPPEPSRRSGRFWQGLAPDPWHRRGPTRAVSSLKALSSTPGRRGRSPGHMDGSRGWPIVPNLIFTGILTIVISLAIVVWAAAFVQRKHGGRILILLSVGMLLVGGGFAPPLVGILAGWAGTGIDSPLTWWRTRLSASLRRLLARLWPSLFGGLFDCIAGAVCRFADHGFRLRLQQRRTSSAAFPVHVRTT